MDHPVEPLAAARGSQAGARAPRFYPTWRNLARYLPAGAIAVAYLLSARRLFHIVRRFAVNIFTGDQWDFNDATLFQQHSWWQAFRWQHGPHRQGLAAVLQKLLDPLIRWNTRYEAFGSVAAIFLAAVAALYLKKRLFGGVAFSDVIIPILFLTPLEFGTLLFSANPANGPLPLLLMALYCLAWTARSHPCRYALVLLVDFVMIYTGFGVFIGVVTPPLIAVNVVRDWRRRPYSHPALSGAALLVSLAALASFFVGYRMAPAAKCFSLRPKNPAQYARFISLMLANFANVNGTGVWPTLTGAILGVVLLLSLCKAVKMFLSPSDQRNRSLVMCALLSFSLIFCVNAAYGRLCLGLDMAQSSRYMIYLVPGFFGVYLYALSERNWATRGSIISGLLLVALLSSFHLNYGDWLLMQASSRNKRAWRNCYLARHNIDECNRLANFKVYPFPSQATQLQQKLDFLERNRLNLYAQ